MKRIQSFGKTARAEYVIENGFVSEPFKEEAATRGITLLDGRFKNADGSYATIS